MVESRPEPADRDARTTELDGTAVPLEETQDELHGFATEDLSDDWQLARCRRERMGVREVPFVGDYPLLRRIGRGGMGTVYGALHPRLGIPVAVKVLHEHLSVRDPSVPRRFEREAKIAASLSSASPHLVRVHDMNRDADSGCHYLVMEYVEGVAAEAWVRDVEAEFGQAAELDALDVCIAATRGLVAAHRRGVVHRDVKPANILIPFGDEGPALGRAKLADLGLARMEHRDERLTAAGQLMLGTPGYSAPEQLEKGSTARKPSDVFAMGATLYRLLSGAPPFDGETHVARAFATLEGRRQPLRQRRADVCDAVDMLVDTCLRRDPSQRFPDASALLEALRLCRGAVLGAAGPDAEVSSHFSDLVRREEEGSSVLSDFVSRVRTPTSRVMFDGGPGGARVRLTPRDGSRPPLDVTLDAHGRLELPEVAVGEYDVIVRHDEFQDLRVRIVVRTGVDQNMPVHMRERSGQLVVASEPTRADVLVDGVRVGPTPLPRMSVAAGTHEIVLRLPGYGIVRREVAVRGGRTADLGTIRLEPCGRLELKGHPDDVEFALDGERVDDGADVDPGVRRLTARRPGYEAQALVVSVEPGQVVRPTLPRWRLNGRALIGSMELWRNASESDRRRAARALARGRADLELVGLHEYRCGDTAHEMAVFRHLPTGTEMVLIPGGTFVMGSPPDEADRRTDERQHDVALDPYLIMRTPVTRQVWHAVMEEPAPPAATAQHAVEVRTWDRAAAFCQRAGLMLPSEAEWENACRAGARTAFAWGDEPNRASAAADVDGGWGAPPRDVGGRSPNAFGLLDTHGGVWEWCRDRYGEYPFESSSNVDESGNGAYRVLRGGSRFDPPRLARAAYRCAVPPDVGIVPAGVRAVAIIHADDASDPVESSVSGTEIDDA